jgi:RimJ/RimL family protein N-acetyltransferase
MVQRPGSHRISHASLPLSHRSQQEFLESHSQPEYNGASFAIITRTDSVLIGGCDLRAERLENRSASLGIAIGDKSYWDGGYGTDAMRVLCRFGFEHMNLHRIELEVYAGNERARHVYEKVGFTVEACRRQAHFKYGKYMDVFVMGLLEGELRLTPDPSPRARAEGAWGWLKRQTRQPIQRARQARPAQVAIAVADEPVADRLHPRDLAPRTDEEHVGR